MIPILTSFCLLFNTAVAPWPREDVYWNYNSASLLAILNLDPMSRLIDQLPRGAEISDSSSLLPRLIRLRDTEVGDSTGGVASSDYAEQFLSLQDHLNTTTSVNSFMVHLDSCLMSDLPYSVAVTIPSLPSSTMSVAYDDFARFSFHRGSAGEETRVIKINSISRQVELPSRLVVGSTDESPPHTITYNLASIVGTTVSGGSSSGLYFAEFVKGGSNTFRADASDGIVAVSGFSFNTAILDSAYYVRDECLDDGLTTTANPSRRVVPIITTPIPTDSIYTWGATSTTPGPLLNGHRPTTSPRQ